MNQIMSDSEAAVVAKRLQLVNAQPSNQETTAVRIDCSLLPLIDVRRKTIPGENGQRARRQNRGEIVSEVLRLGFKFLADLESKGIPGKPEK